MLARFQPGFYLVRPEAGILQFVLAYFLQSFLEVSIQQQLLFSLKDGAAVREETRASEAVALYPPPLRAAPEWSLLMGIPILSNTIDDQRLLSPCVRFVIYRPQAKPGRPRAGKQSAMISHDPLGEAKHR